MTKSKYTGLILCGDFNCPNINWHSGVFGSCEINENSFENSFLDCLDDCFYYQNVFEPTFQTHIDHPKSILDLIITENSERVYNINHGPPLGNKNKGHLTLRWDYILKPDQSTINNSFRSSSYNYQHGDFDSISRLIGEINWDKLFDGLDADKMYDKFVSIYDFACSRFVPKKNLKRKDKPWMTKDLKNKIRSKYKAWKSFIASGRKDSMKQAYISIRNNCQKSINSVIKN
ncbi:unnamed protein product, partial [Brachionus calyciflorus]